MSTCLARSVSNILTPNSYSGTVGSIVCRMAAGVSIEARRAEHQPIPDSATEHTTPGRPYSAPDTSAEQDSPAFCFAGQPRLSTHRRVSSPCRSNRLASQWLSTFVKSRTVHTSSGNRTAPLQTVHRLVHTWGRTWATSCLYPMLRIACPHGTFAQ